MELVYIPQSEYPNDIHVSRGLQQYLRPRKDDFKGSFHGRGWQSRPADTGNGLVQNDLLDLESLRPGHFLTFCSISYGSSRFLNGPIAGLVNLAHLLYTFQAAWTTNIHHYWR